MLLGMSLSTFTLVHVIISLIAIATGFAVGALFTRSKEVNVLTGIFLASTTLTSITGFMFPFTKVTPGIIVGVISMLVLALAVPAKYAFRLSGKWRTTYVVTSMIALYFNVFVLVVQSFQKVPALHALAPTGEEAPFKIVQLVILVGFIALSTFAVRGFRLRPGTAAAAIP